MNDKAQPGNVTSNHGRIRLALSILNHRPFCSDCRRHVDAAALALTGATIDEIQRLTA